MTVTTFELAAKAVPARAAASRRIAFASIAPAAYSEAQSRASVIAAMRAAIGLDAKSRTAPPETLINAVCVEWLAGRVAFRLAPSDFPKGCTDAVARIDYARSLICDYVAPSKSAKPSALKRGKAGRRTETQHRVIRNAEEALSVLKAELGIGAAQTQEERAKNNASKSKRAPHHNSAKVDPDNMPVNGKGVASKATTGAASPVKATSRESAVEHVAQQASSLALFANKNAKLLPAEFGQAILAFKSAINKAMNAEQVRRAKADAIAADKAK